MPMMKPTPVEDKPVDLQRCLDELQTFVRSAAGAGTPVHEVERGVWRRLLQLGYQLQGQFFALVGDGDQAQCPHRRKNGHVFDLWNLRRSEKSLSKFLGPIHVIGNLA